MKDKSVILEEVRRKTEEDLAKERKRVMRLVVWLGTVPVTIVCCVFLFAFHRQPFPFNIWPFFIPFIGYFLSRRKMMKEYCSHYEEALKVLEKEPQSADDYVERARILYSHKFYEAAVEDYRTALEIEPNHYIAWYDLSGTLWRKLHRADEALSIVERLSATPGDYQPWALVLQGEILAENDPVAALKCFDKAIKLEPNDPDHHLARLRFYLDTDRLTETAEAIRETTKKLNQRANGPCSELYELRALLAMKQGRTADAVKELNVAIRVDRFEEKYYRLRSDAHEALGNLEKANADRRKAQEIGERQ